VTLRRLLAPLLAFPGAVWASHPLMTEDTGVLGAARWQVELHGERSLEREAGARTRGADASGVLSYGITEQADVQLELPYLRKETGGDVVKGRGDASASLKWRFFERDRLSLVVKPDLHLPTGREELGLGAGRARWGTNFVASYQFGPLELLGHAGYLRNRNRIGERVSLWHTSIAALYAATDKLKLALDVGRDTNPDPESGSAMRELVLGLVYALSDDVDLGLGVKKGLSDPADDRAVLAGLKFRW
jgi:hypothetical protein